jgi:hypothetical protein
LLDWSEGEIRESDPKKEERLNRKYLMSCVRMSEKGEEKERGKMLPRRC